ncbi:MAG: molybdopterin-dependent oxidoreductase [Betaproteobacteria bacterium]
MSLHDGLTRREFLATTGAVATATASGPVWASMLPAGSDAADLEKAGFKKKFVTCFMCGAGCGLTALTKDDSAGKHVYLLPNTGHPQRGYCGRGASALWIWSHPLRLAQPLKRVGARGEGKFEPVSWDVALDEIAAKLKTVVTATGERSVVFTAHDLTPLAQTMAYALGTPNVINHSSTCLTPGAVARRWTFERPYDHHRRVDPDYENCRYIVFMGRTLQASMGAAHRLAQARARGDLKVIYVDPRRPDQAFADSEWLPIVPGTDAAFALALVRELIDKKLYDAKFVADFTNAPLLIRADGLPLTRAEVTGQKDATGYAVWNAKANAVAFQSLKLNDKKEPVGFLSVPADAEPALDYVGEVTLADGKKVAVKTAFVLLRERVAPYTPNYAGWLTGIDSEVIRRVASELAQYRGVIDDGWYLTRNGNDTDTVRAMLIVNVLLGNIDRKGGLAMSRAAGLSYLGLSGNTVTLPHAKFELADTRRMDTIVYPESSGTFQVAVDAILTGKPYPVTALFAVGTTLIQRESNAPRLIEALKKLELLVMLDVVPQELGDYADYVLPANFFLERSELSDVKWTLDAALHESQPVLPMPKGIDGRDDLWILLEILRRAYPDRAQKVGYGAAQASAEGYGKFKQGIDDKMKEAVLKRWVGGEPGVAERVNKELNQHGYSVLGAKKFDETPYLKPLATASGKIEIYALRPVLTAALRQGGADPLPDYKPVTAYTRPSQADEFYVVSGKSMSSSSGTAAYAASARAMGDRSVWIDPADAKRLGIATGDAIELEGLDSKQRGQAKAKLTSRVKPGVLFTYAFSGGYRARALERDPRFAFMREGINPNVLGNGRAERLTGALANNFSARVRKV